MTAYSFFAVVFLPTTILLTLPACKNAAQVLGLLVLSQGILAQEIVSVYVFVMFLRSPWLVPLDLENQPLNSKDNLPSTPDQGVALKREVALPLVEETVEGG